LKKATKRAHTCNSRNTWIAFTIVYIYVALTFKKYYNHSTSFNPQEKKHIFHKKKNSSDARELQIFCALLGIGEQSLDRLN